MAKYEVFDELPAGVGKATRSTSKVFTDELTEVAEENANKWVKVPDGTAQGAAAYVKRLKESGRTGFEYKSVDTGKPNGPKKPAPKNKDVMYQPTIKDVYVRFSN